VRTASSVNSEQIGMTTKNTSSSTGRLPIDQPVVYRSEYVQWRRPIATTSHSENSATTGSNESSNRRGRLHTRAPKTTSSGRVIRRHRAMRTRYW
jgi:hypothetical protein